MISVICPYCEGIKCILLDPCMHELITKGKSIVDCPECGKKYLVYNGSTKFEVRKYECDSSN